LEVEVVEQDNTDMPSHIKLVLEEQPKWKLLRTILEEIQTDTIEESAPILIMVSDTRTCSQIKQYIANTDSLFLKQIARSFFKWRSNIQSVQTNYNNQQQKPQQQQQQQQQQQPQQQSQQQQQQAPTPQGGRGPPNKRRRVRGGSAAASNPGRSSLADTFKNDVIETTKM
jgi:DNA excision repair protein ERCC-4